MIGRAERRAAKREKRTARTLREIDYLLMVDDEARQRLNARGHEETSLSFEGMGHSEVYRAADADAIVARRTAGGRADVRAARSSRMARPAWKEEDR